MKDYKLFEYNNNVILVKNKYLKQYDIFSINYISYKNVKNDFSDEEIFAALKEFAIDNEDSEYSITIADNKIYFEIFPFESITAVVIEISPTILNLIIGDFPLNIINFRRNFLKILKSKKKIYSKISNENLLKLELGLQ